MILIKSRIHDSKEISSFLVIMKTPRGLVLLALGSEESRDTDSGEKVATAVTRIISFLEMCGY